MAGLLHGPERVVALTRRFRVPTPPSRRQLGRGEGLHRGRPGFLRRKNHAGLYRHECKITLYKVSKQIIAFRRTRTNGFPQAIQWYEPKHRSCCAAELPASYARCGSDLVQKQQGSGRGGLAGGYRRLKSPICGLES